MVKSPVVAGLKAKRNEIAFQIRRLQADLDHIDAAIMLVSARGVRLPRPPKAPDPRGTISKLIYEAFRRADGPISTVEISAHVAARRGLDTADPDVMRAVVDEIGKSLARSRRRGLLTGERRGHMTWWSLPL